MPTAARPGQRAYQCEGCEGKWSVKAGGFALETECGECGGVAYASPFPLNEALKRLDALTARLVAEDGPMRGEGR